MSNLSKSQRFIIEETEKTDFIGFTIDSDQRFLLDNFIVANNCPGELFYFFKFFFY